MVLSEADAQPLEAPRFQGDQQASFFFTGPLGGRTVTWHCELMTLSEHARLSGQGSQQQFLDISPGASPGHYDIRIGLALDRIDSAAVRRCIIMVRKYKRLSVGLHRYGETHRYD